MAEPRTLSLAVSGPEKAAYDVAAEASGMTRHAWCRAILNAASGASALPEQMEAASARAEGLKAPMCSHCDGPVYTVPQPCPKREAGRPCARDSA